MSDATDPDAKTPPPILADDQLPPVEPPATGFLVQLFLIPMLIVGIIVVVWLLFSWLAQMGNRPEELVQDLERLNHASWQKALTLANTLQDPRMGEVRRNPKLAKRLADTLERHVEEGSTDEDHIWLRMYLCLALGEFESLEGLPALITAARTERDVRELDVRRTAVWAIGRLAERVSASELVANEDVMQVLEQAAGDTSEMPDELRSRGRVRSTAAFVYGQLPSEAARDQLARMLSDPYPDVRYNAATGLARQGDPRAVETLVDMLDPENEETVRFEEDERQHEWKRNDVLVQALRAARALAETNSAAELSPLEAPIRRIASMDLGGPVEVESRETLRVLRLDP